MNNLFLLLTVLSFLDIPIFIIGAIINLIRKNPAKKRFKWAGLSALAFIIGTVIFGDTMEHPIIPDTIKLSITDYQAKYDINAEIP